MNNNLRWESYVLMRGIDSIISFWNNHLLNKKRNILFVLGKGFDIRMNEGIKQIANCNSDIIIKCFLIEYDEGTLSSSYEYKKLVEENYIDLNNIKNIEIELKKIQLWSGKGRSKRRIGDKEAADIFSSYAIIQSFSDIIIDISSLPRGIYFSLIGKLLALIDNNKINGIELQNFFVLTSENAKIDQFTIEEDIDDDLKYAFGFGGGLELTFDDPVIWFPILGENKRNQIIKAYNKINPREICPLLPFPAKDPRRSDTLIIEYHQLLFDELRVESQNLLYVPEQNPFEVYRNLCNAIINYYKTLLIINGCKAVISTFSSKLLSIGAILSAYELNSREFEKVDVGVLNVESKGYKIENEDSLDKLHEESELFLIWLTGDPYNTK